MIKKKETAVTDKERKEKERRKKEQKEKAEAALERIQEARKERMKRKKMLRRETKHFDRCLKAKNKAIQRLNQKAQKEVCSALPKEKRDAKKVLNLVTPLLQKDELLLLKTQLENNSRKRNVYSNDFKRLVIAISYKSSAAYRYLSQRLRLPTKRTVRRWVAGVHFSEGFDDSLFLLLKNRVALMPEKDRYITLLADEISLRECFSYDTYDDKIFGCKKFSQSESYVNASSALVFMATGFRSKWRQALAYFFSAGPVCGKPLYDRVEECISRLHKCGLKVVALVSDQGSNFSNLLLYLKVTPQRPFFIHEGQKIYALPDPPHLIKSIRNCLHDHAKITTPDGEVQWAHIKHMFELDSQRLRMAPKLTQQHIFLPAIFGKMRVYLATQVLSHSVAKAMKAYVKKGLLPESYLATSKFCQRFNDLFDLMNSSVKNGSTPYKCGLSLEADEMFDFIDSSIAWIESLKVFDQENNNVTQRFRCLDGMILALASIRAITIDMCTNHGFDFVLTRRLNQDPLENLFGIIRQRGGFNMNPTCKGFAAAYKICQMN